MKYITVLLLAVVAVPSHGQKWNHESENQESSMPNLEDRSGESESEGDYESTMDDILEEFIDSNGMSFSDFSDYMNDCSSYYSDDSESQSTVVHTYSASFNNWDRRIYRWEDEIPDIMGFAWMLKQLDLSRMQMSYLDALTLWVELEIDELQDYHEIDDIRNTFFEDFVEDFYMPIEMYFLWEDRNWYESDLHDLIADAMSEIHEMLSIEQLADARQIVEYMLSNQQPDLHTPYEGDYR